jgi:molecular chaperone GrpE
MRTLAGAGLEVVNPLGEQFDPGVHEAVSTVAADGPEQENSISAVFQPGYRFKGQLLRPARVVVRKWNG